MPIQSVFTSQAPAEAPAARPRAGEARKGAGGETFELPRPQDAAREARPADKRAGPAAAREQPEASAPQEAKADAGGTAVPIVIVPDAAAAETASAGEEPAGKAKAAGEGEVAATATAPVPIVILPALPPPLGGDAAAAEAGTPAAKPAVRPAIAMGVAPTGPATEQASSGIVAAAVGKAGQGSSQAAAMPGADLAGKAAEPVAARAAQPATEAKAADAPQQPPAVFDVSSLLQQATAAAGPQPLAQAFDPAAAPGGAGQGAASGPPTPVHVVPIEIGLRAMAGVRQFDIRLDPDELGRVDVNLSISDKGEVSAKLVVDRVETLHLLQRDARTLERAFEQAGLKPSDGGIDISLRDPSGQPGFRQNREQDAAPERPRPADGGEPADDATLSIDPVPQRRLIRLGGVDLSI